MKKSIATVLCSSLLLAGGIFSNSTVSAQILKDTATLGAAYGEMAVQRAEDEARYKVFQEKFQKMNKLHGESKEKTIQEDEKYQRLREKLQIRGVMLEEWGGKQRELLKSADIKPAVSVDGKKPPKSAQLIAAKEDMDTKYQRLQNLVQDLYEFASENGDKLPEINELFSGVEVARQSLRQAAAKYVEEYWRWRVKPGQGIDTTESDFQLLTKNGYIKMESQQLKNMSRSAAASRVAFMLRAVEGGVYNQLAPESIAAMARLRAEYSLELAQLGYFDDEAAQIQVETQAIWESSTKAPKRFKVDGELRVDHRKNSGDVSNDSFVRLRNRLYGDYNIDENWHAIAMVESQKYLSGRGNNHWLELDRYYLTGYIGEVAVSGGVMGATMAEGNIYDSKFKGVMLQAGDGVHYTLRYGTVNNAHNAVEFSADYKIGSGYRINGGYHGFNIDGYGRRNIYTGNIIMPLGANLALGAMYLQGQDSQLGTGRGYVFTLSHGRESSWKKGNMAYFLKYYHQPRATYVQHTMNGTADSMNGFMGLGLGASYTIQESLIISMEYYRLRELMGNRSNNTLWLGLSYYYH